MSDFQKPNDFTRRLLEQDELIRSDRYKEHRMQLEQQLVRAEARKRLTKQVLIGATLIAAGVFPLVGSGILGSPDPYDKNANWLSVSAGAVYILSISIVFIGLASYYSRLAPGVNRAREDLRDESIRELHKEVARLARMVEEAIKGNQGKEGSGTR